MAKDKEKDKKKKKKKAVERIPSIARPARVSEPTSGPAMPPSLAMPPEDAAFLDRFINGTVFENIDMTGLAPPGVRETVMVPQGQLPKQPEPTIGAQILGAVTGQGSPLDLMGGLGDAIQQGRDAISQGTQAVTEPVTSAVNDLTQAGSEGPLGDVRTAATEAIGDVSNLGRQARASIAQALAPSDLQSPTYAAESARKLFGEEGMDTKTAVGRAILGLLAPNLARSLTEAGLETLDLPSNQLTESQARRAQAQTAREAMGFGSDRLGMAGRAGDLFAQRAGQEAQLATIGGGQAAAGGVSPTDVGTAAAAVPMFQLREAGARGRATRGDVQPAQAERQLELQEAQDAWDRTIDQHKLNFAQQELDLEKAAQAFSQNMSLEEIKLMQRRMSLNENQFLSDRDFRNRKLALEAAMIKEQGKQWRAAQELDERQARMQRAAMTMDNIWSKFLPPEDALAFMEVLYGERDMDPELRKSVMESQAYLSMVDQLARTGGGGGAGAEKNAMDLYKLMGQQLSRYNDMLESGVVPTKNEEFVKNSINALQTGMTQLERQFAEMGLQGGTAPGGRTDQGGAGGGEERAPVLLLGQERNPLGVDQRTFERAVEAVSDVSGALYGMSPQGQFMQGLERIGEGAGFGFEPRPLFGPGTIRNQDELRRRLLEAQRDRNR